MSVAGHVARIGKLSTIYTVSGMVPYILGVLVATPIFTRYLPPDQMNIVTLPARVMEPLSILFQLGVIQALKSYFFRTEAALRPQLVHTVWVGQLSQLGALCLALSVAGIWLARPLLPNLPVNGTQLYWVWLMAVWTCFFTGLYRLANGLASLLEQGMKVAGLAQLNYLSQLAFGLIAVVALSCQGIGRQASVFLGALVTGCTCAVVLSRYSRGGFKWATYGRVLTTGVTFIPHTLSLSLALVVNAWILNHYDFAGRGLLAIYNQALVFATLLEFPLTAFNAASYPTFAKLMSDGSPEARRQQSRIYTLLITAFSGIALAVYLFAPVAIRILTGKEYHEAARVAPILVMGYLFNGLYMVAGNPIFYTGGGLWMTLASASSMLVNVALSFLLIPRYGMYGAAWAAVGCLVVRFLVAATVSQYKYALPWQVGILLRGVIGAVGLGAIDYVVSPRLTPAGAIALKAALVVAAVPLAWVTGVVSSAELSAAWGLVRSRIARRR